MVLAPKSDEGGVYYESLEQPDWHHVMHWLQALVLENEPPLVSQVWSPLPSLKVSSFLISSTYYDLLILGKRYWIHKVIDWWVYGQRQMHWLFATVNTTRMCQSTPNTIQYSMQHKPINIDISMLYHHNSLSKALFVKTEYTGISVEEVPRHTSYTVFWLSFPPFRRNIMRYLENQYFWT